MSGPESNQTPAGSQTNSKSRPRQRRVFNFLLRLLDLERFGFFSVLLVVPLLLPGLHYLIWYSHGEMAVNLTAFYALFMAADLALLYCLPILKRSYGSEPGQLLTMNVPRLLVAGIASLCYMFTPYALHLELLLQSLGSLAYVYGMVYETGAPVLTNMKLSSNKLRQPLRIIHLSDIHIERLSQRETLILELLKHIKPDLILFTGDYLNYSNLDDPRAQQDLRRFMMELEAPLGVFGVMGSPAVDRRSNVEAIFAGTPLRLLRNQILHIPHIGLEILGVDCEHYPEKDGLVFQHLMNESAAGGARDNFRLLLYHSPEIMPLVREYPVDMYLCGHTHGGQIRAPIYGAIVTSSKTGKRYEKGLYMEKSTGLYVNAGLGLEGKAAPRMRLFCRPEMVLWDLTPAGSPGGESTAETS